MKIFEKILIANRGEIAIRIMRAANEMGKKTVAVFAEEDKLGLHRFKADEAYRIGLYNHLVANNENVVDTASNLATALTKAPITALRETKKALHRELSVDFSTALDQEAKLQASLMKHPDFREAYNAFVTKRPPRFS